MTKNKKNLQFLNDRDRTMPFSQLKRSKELNSEHMNNIQSYSASVAKRPNLNIAYSAIRMNNKETEYDYK